MSMKKTVYAALDVLGIVLLAGAVYFAAQCQGARPVHAQQAEQAQLGDLPSDPTIPSAATATPTAETHEAVTAQDTDTEPGMSGSVQEDDATAPGWTEQEVELGKLAIHEGSGRDADTVAITQARGRWTLERLRTEHPRALSPVGIGTRPWIAGLNGELTRPAQWNEERMPWARFRPVWLRTLQTVRRTLQGGARCAGGAPQIWGGRMDSHHINRRLTQGFRILNCGNTANVFMRRDRQ